MYDNIPDFSRLAMVYGEEAAQAIYDDKVGKFVIVEAREDNTTRVFIRDMNMFGDARRKEGWWNTFSICNAPVDKGFYMGRIDKVKYDKDGYPIFVIYIVRCVPDDILQHTELCYVFARSLLFLDTFTNPDSDYNHDALFQLAQTHAALHAVLNAGAICDDERGAGISFCFADSFESLSIVSTHSDLCRIYIAVGSRNHTEVFFANALT